MPRIEGSALFKIQVPATSVGQLVEQKKMVAFKLPEHLQAELALHDQQVEARQQANQAAAAGPVAVTEGDCTRPEGHGRRDQRRPRRGDACGGHYPEEGQLTLLRPVNSIDTVHPII